MRLKGKTALIAGASRNIGREIALTFAREGADLILLARKSGDELKAVAQECERAGVRALPVAADIGNPEDVNRAVKQGLDRFGYVDVLMSVAAIRPHKPFWEIGYDEWNQVMAVNLSSTFYLAKALALELGPYNVRANLLAAGLIGTERRNPEWYPEGGGVPHGMAHKTPDATPVGHSAGTPLGRHGRSQEVANVALFLASDESSFVTGDRIICAGGRYM